MLANFKAFFQECFLPSSPLVYQEQSDSNIKKNKFFHLHHLKKDKIDIHAKISY